jgi:hypothetical protein
MVIVALELQVCTREIYKETDVWISLLQDKLFSLLADSFH